MAKRSRAAATPVIAITVTERPRSGGAFALAELSSGEKYVALLSHGHPSSNLEASSEIRASPRGPPSQPAASAFVNVARAVGAAMS